MTPTAALKNLYNLTTDQIEKLANCLTKEVYGETNAASVRDRGSNDKYDANMGLIKAHLTERGFVLATYADGTYCVRPA